MKSKDELRNEIQETMSQCRIPGASIVYQDSDGVVTPVVKGVTDRHSCIPGAPVDANTVFGAASLSKPVFSYLILKLIKDKKLVTTEGEAFDLDTPISKLLPRKSYSIADFYRELDITHVDKKLIQRAKIITPRMILSHTTGIGINGDFEPGPHYAYSGVPLMYLQKILEKSTGQSLEEWAQSEIFTPLDMTHSSFYPNYELGLIDEIVPDSPLTPSKMYLKISEEGLQYQVLKRDAATPQAAIIPWSKLPDDFPRDLADLTQIKKQFLPAILDITSEKYTYESNNAANSLQTTPSEYVRFITAWMKEKDCALVKMSGEPTLESLSSKSPTSRYIFTETDCYYYDKTNHKLEKLGTLPPEAILEGIKQSFPEVTEDTPLEKLSSVQLKTIIRITGYSNPLQEAFIPQVSLKKDRWASDVGVSEQTREHLAWGLGVGLQLDDHGEVTTVFHTGDMNQWRGWVAMDVLTKSGVVYFANGNTIMNGSGHGYGHVLSNLIVAPVVNVEHVMNWFFKKFPFPTTVAAVLEQQSEDKKKGAMIGGPAVERQYPNHTEQSNASGVMQVVAHPELPATSALASLEDAREISQRFKTVLEEVNSKNSTSSATAEGSSVNEQSPLSPFNTTLKPKLPGE